MGRTGGWSSHYSAFPMVAEIKMTILGPSGNFVKKMTIEGPRGVQRALADFFSDNWGPIPTKNDKHFEKNCIFSQIR